MTLLHSEAAEIPLSGLRILVAEDDALIAEELRERLTRLGASVQDVVADAAGAIAAARRAQPDVVLMDVRLRGQMDGIEAAHEIQRHVDPGIVFVSAHSDRQTLARAKAIGSISYLLKPFSEGQLVVAIQLAVRDHTSVVGRTSVDFEASSVLSRQSGLVDLVGGDASVLAQLRRALEGHGLRVRLFSRLTEVPAHSPDHGARCVVVDVENHTGDHAVDTSMPVIALVAANDIRHSIQALKNGVFDCLVKPIPPELLLTSVKQALIHHEWTLSRRDTFDGVRMRYANLTDRERTVFSLIVQGRLNRQIAANLEISERTVKAHRAQIMSKLQARSVAELTRLSVLLGL
jgi:FixJ family two-component response regulator